jgi:NAD(P)-dependent dehydrogenase (short-subunit alcohol dehydrogenase family)
MSETQRVAIVTGAAGGIGRAMTRGLLTAGVRVAGVDRDREPLEALAASTDEQGKAAELLTIQTGLTNDSAADEITTATHNRFGRIDILVNNAGIGPGSIRLDSWQRPLKFWEITPDQWRRFVAVHTTAPLALANAVVPEMMREGWGRIINVTTNLGTVLNAGSPTYGPSKAALEALSAIMAKDLDGTGVTVNVLVPGGVTDTPMISDEVGFDRGKLIQPEVMVAPQQSPLPLHQSPTIVAQSRSSEAIKYAARLSLQRCSSGRARRARRQPGASSLLCAPDAISILRRQPDGGVDHAHAPATTAFKRCSTDP